MRRRLPNFLSAASVMLCVAVAALCLVSYWYVFGVLIHASGRWYGVLTRDGTLILMSSNEERHKVMWVAQRTGPSPLPGSSMLGFRWWKSYSGGSVGIPIWLVAFALGLPPLLRWRTRRRRR